ncbi:MAG: NADH-quinone oxidoreductase subunit C [Prevotellaceae bacterium]|jgi:Ni,Fe-hydrogenase III large subunit|nr:NADH-quinone oxidoreductase subunit C [Prevotellaceae bacterium]
MKTKNNIPLDIKDITFLSKDDFRTKVSELLSENGARCIAYFAVRDEDSYSFFCGIANDFSHDIDVQAAKTGLSEDMDSLTPEYAHIHIFEREMHEQYGIRFRNHPWLKPLRYSFDRFDREQIPDNYPFFSIESDELHEVGVGPIHAGIIEPGPFRFICEGEKVLHLEIVLGYQHRGLESMMKGRPDLGKMLLSEAIAGDSTVAHSLAYVSTLEAVSGFVPGDRIQLERCIALELERIAVHIGDISALCMDVAYQLGQVSCEALRTIVINTFQTWCGSRFARGLVRPYGTNYPVNELICDMIRRNLHETLSRYRDIAGKILSLPSLLARFEDVGTVTGEQAILAGLTGLSARASGLGRDIRKSHPFLYYQQMENEVRVEKNGDILSRLKQRISEIEQSFALVNNFLNILEQMLERDSPLPECSPPLKPAQLCFSLTEGWRGEVCHSIISDSSGKISFYKIKDPSLHNWFGLALAMRNQDISDFPICNKSFNLSYCGFDL